MSLRVPRVARRSGGHGCVSLSALLADAVYLESVPRGCVLVSAPDLLLQLTHFLGEKFDRTAALRADHVMVAPPVVLMLVARNAIMERDFAGQSAFRQQLKRAIDGGETNAGVFFMHQAMQFVGRKMISGFEKRPQDGVTLRRLLEADPLEMAVQNILRLAHHLAGNRGLVINALLQHGRIENPILAGDRLETGPFNSSLEYHSTTGN
jgi:hypothetical protein